MIWKLVRDDRAYLHCLHHQAWHSLEPQPLRLRLRALRALALEDLPVFSLNGAPGTTRLSELGLYFDVDAIANGDIVPTNTGDVRDNVPGKYGEWRNGALTIQAVRVNADNTDAFTTSLAVTSGGKHGGATGGLLWEATVFWHWDGPSYHESKNTFEPAPNVQVAGQPVAHTTAPAGR